LNPWPPHCERGALPTELRPRPNGKKSRLLGECGPFRTVAPHCQGQPKRPILARARRLVHTVL